MLLLKGARTFAPQDLGNVDILVGADKVLAIENGMGPMPVEVETLNLSNFVLAPGLIDLHVHFAGAGGEGGPLFRAEPLNASSLLESGITTAVGLLGTDGYARNVMEVLQKAYALEAQGVSTYIYTGSYKIPSVTITGDVAVDIMAVEKVLGLKIAIADHRSSHPTVEEFVRLASQVRVAGILSGKVGIFHLHVGTCPDPLFLVRETNKRTSIPLYHFLPTHMNRNETVLEEALKFALEGGNVDFTAISDMKRPQAHEAVSKLLEASVPLDRITVSSDAGGSSPLFDSDGRLLDVKITTPQNLMAQFLQLLDAIGPEKALTVFSTNPAKRLGLRHKGKIEEGFDADFLIFDDAWSLRGVIAKGRLVWGKI
jgi:beta-aspartyl-dipeptidase (metallo-type)